MDWKRKKPLCTVQLYGVYNLINLPLNLLTLTCLSFHLISLPYTVISKFIHRHTTPHNLNLLPLQEETVAFETSALAKINSVYIFILSKNVLTLTCLSFNLISLPRAVINKFIHRHSTPHNLYLLPLQEEIIEF